MFFRNLSLWRLDPDVCEDTKRLGEAIASHALRDCGPLELSTQGFVPPVGQRDDSQTLLDVGQRSLMCLGGQEKLLPPAVVTDEMNRRVRKIVDEESRRVGSRERKQIKEDVVTELVQRAFVRNSRTAAYVDRTNGWLVIDTASRKASENVVTQIRSALGSFPVVPLAPEESPRVLMTAWLSSERLPAGFTLGDECELRDPSTSAGAVAVCRRQDMDAEEVKEHLRNGKQVFKLGLVYNDRLSFVLGEDLTVRKLKFLDAVMENLSDTDDDELTDAMARFTLATLELEPLLDQLATIFGLALDAPLRLHRQEVPAGLQEPINRFFRDTTNALGPGGSVTISAGGHSLTLTGDADDNLYAQAVEVVKDTRRASISAIQRHLRIGYNRAARLVEQMEQNGVVSAPLRDGAREVLGAPS